MPPSGHLEAHSLLEDIPSPIATVADATSRKSHEARHRPGYARLKSDSIDYHADGDLAGTLHATEPLVPAAVEDVAHPGIPTQAALTAKQDGNNISPHSRGSLAAPTDTDAGFRGPSPPVGDASGGDASGGTGFDQSHWNIAHSDAEKPTYSHVSVAPDLRSSIRARSDTDLFSSSIGYDGFEPNKHCRSSRNVRHSRFAHWAPISVLILAMLSTIISGVFWIIALTGWKWGKVVRPKGGALAPTTAAFLTSLLAKLAELAFVTVAIAFLGQVLARRVSKLEGARGVTLAEMSMRTWIMQPGSMMTHWESVRYAAASLLGLASVIATLAAMLYTSASTALVQPRLSLEWEPAMLGGLVQTSVANIDYISEHCKTPIQSNYDTSDNGRARRDDACQLESASMAYHNYYSYLGMWADSIRNGSGGQSFDTRPQGYALYLGNTTISAPWIERHNISVMEDKSMRFVNNVTMALPHVGVVQASLDPINGLIQPKDMDGMQINIRASVPSPMVNVLCVTMHKPDLKPFVYSMWDGIPKDWNYTMGYGYNDQYLNGTAFDDVFRWGERYGRARYPPVFPRLPIDFNTLVNDTTGLAWGRETVYLLGKGGRIDSELRPTVDEHGDGINYALCQIQVGLTGSCSTHYNASISGASMAAVCEDDTDPMQYSKLNDVDYAGNNTLNIDMAAILANWARSLSLQTGIVDSNNTNSRVLTQMIATKAQFNVGLPSMAEALAVLVGGAAIQLVIDSPFVLRRWNYTLSALSPGKYEYFNASVRAQQYISGGTQNYQKAFHLVLFTVFIMSLLILVYFLFHKTWYTDFSEPMNLFSAAVNSPPSEKMAGSCGCGPTGEQYRLNWKLNNDGGHFYYEAATEGVVDVQNPRLAMGGRFSQGFEMMASPIASAKDRFSRAHT